MRKGGDGKKERILTIAVTMFPFLRQPVLRPQNVPGSLKHLLTVPTRRLGVVSVILQPAVEIVLTLPQNRVLFPFHTLIDNYCTMPQMLSPTSDVFSHTRLSVWIILSVW